MSWPSAHNDHSFDDAADDSCALNYAHNNPFWPLNRLFSEPARSWQCGGQGFESA
jgi:hypothetical protein